MKKILIVMLCAIIAFLLCGCRIGNREVGIDTRQTFSHATIYLGNDKIVEGKVDSWRDFEDGDEVQVTVNGVTYLTHYSNVVLDTKNR